MTSTNEIISSLERISKELVNIYNNKFHDIMYGIIYDYMTNEKEICKKSSEYKKIKMDTKKITVILVKMSFSNFLGVVENIYEDEMKMLIITDALMTKKNEIDNFILNSEKFNLSLIYDDIDSLKLVKKELVEQEKIYEKYCKEKNAVYNMLLILEEYEKIKKLNKNQHLKKLDKIIYKNNFNYTSSCGFTLTMREFIDLFVLPEYQYLFPKIITSFIGLQRDISNSNKSNKKVNISNDGNRMMVKKYSLDSLIKIGEMIAYIITNFKLDIYKILKNQTYRIEHFQLWVLTHKLRLPDDTSRNIMSFVGDNLYCADVEIEFFRERMLTHIENFRY